MHSGTPDPYRTGRRLLRADRRTRQAPGAYIMETQRNESSEVLCEV